MALAAAAGAVALGALAQSLTGFGFALVSVPFLVFALGPGQAVRLVLALSLAINLLLLTPGWRRVRLLDGVLLSLPAIAIAPPVAWLARRADPGALAVAAGVLTVLAAAAIGAGLRARRLHGRVGALCAGVVSGTMNTVAGIGGPPVAMYAANAGWPPPVSRPTMQVVFFASNAASLASLGLPRFHPALVGGTLAGWLAGVAVSRRVADRAVRRATLALAVLGGLAAIARGLSG